MTTKICTNIKKISMFLFLFLFVFSLITISAMAETTTGTIDSGIGSSGISVEVSYRPSADIEAGTYTSNQSITLTSSGADSIYYTIDGSTPTCSSGTEYSSAVTVSSSLTLKAIACKSNGGASSVGSFAYVLQCATTSVTNGSVAAYPGCAITCNSGYTLSGSTCAASGGGGGGGGGSAAPSTVMPITTTGVVTATNAAGGQTTLTDSDGTKATVTVPAGTVSNSSAFQITAVEKTSDTASGMVFGVGSGQSIVGNLYSFTAQSGSSALKTFSNNLTITMTYTSEQIAGLNESDLKIYYWDTDTSTWIALICTVNKENNTITATTNHFTYFAIMTGAGTGEEGSEVTVGETAGIVDGDVVRAPDASGMDQFDVYIVKLINGKKFRRLVLSPHVFESYGHLQWGNIKDISDTQMQTYEISNIIRCYDPTEGVDDPKVYRLYPDGDAGAKRWMNMTANKFGASYDWDSIYFINKIDRDAYITGEGLTS